MKKLAFIAAAVALVFSTNVRADSSLSAIQVSNYNSTKTAVGVRTPKAKTKVSTSYGYTGTKVAVSSKYNAGPKPGRWCGWFMRTIFGGGPEYNLARNWSKRGTSAGGPRVGAVVVWPHHVGVITGRASDGRWIVKSGNDSNRVRERARSVAGAIAFRFV